MQIDPSQLATAPKRARAALAAQVDFEIGRQWLASAMPRAGFVASPSLLRLLKALGSAQKPSQW
jgi:hypothetical protein